MRQSNPHNHRIYQGRSHGIASICGDVFFTTERGKGPETQENIEELYGEELEPQEPELKARFDKVTMKTFSTLFTTIYRTKLRDYKSSHECGQAIVDARNEFIKLECPQTELAVSLAFLQGLGNQYSD